MKECKVKGCDEVATGYSTHCERHKRAQRRHGHAEQPGITGRQLTPYIKRVQARRRINPASPVWDILRDRWATVVGNAMAHLEAHAKGRASATSVTQAASHLRRVGEDAPQDVVIDTALAMFVMREADPRRFRSDRAFDFQLARRVRALTESNVGIYFDQDSNKVKRVYRDIAPATLAAIAEPLKAAFGVAGLRLADLDKRDVERGHAKQQSFAKALKELQ